VWDTALSILALRDAGVPSEHPAIARGAEWLLDEEVRQHGDWSIARPGLEPGGWAFEFANVNYPDIDDTAEVVLALHSVAGGHGAGGADGSDGPSGNGRGAPPSTLAARIEPALARAVRWVEGLQSSDGGWGAFDADNTRRLVRELPFLDFGEVIDEPSADVTAHTVEMLGALGLAGTTTSRRGVRWLLDQQEADGSWFGRWGVNHVYGIGAAVPGLIAAGMDPSHQCIRRAVSWLETHQNDDGGWGEDPRSYDDRAWIGRGPSTPSQTAWALLALHAVGQSGGPGRPPAAPVARGVAWLVESQRADGGWDEPQYTGTGFPSDYYINYHLYRLIFPIMALGRCLAAGSTFGDGRVDAVAERAG
jgi:squalene-hopene/tetraprenyl-beta-curcumene cyclase